MRRTASLLCLVVWIGLWVEGLVRLAHWITPLERPAALYDTVRMRLLAGTWMDGPSRFYTYEPNMVGSTYGHPFRVNSEGFRGPEWRAKRHGITRVLVIGDSMTSGIGIAEKERYTEVAQRRRPDLDIINLSVQGWDAPQYAMALERYGELLQPDIVVIGLYLNDPWTSFEFYAPYHPALPAWVALSLTYRLVEPFYDPLHRFTHGIPTRDQLMQQAYAPSSNDWQIFTASLQRLVDWTERHSLRRPLALLLVNAPEATATGYYAPLLAACRALLAVCVEGVSRSRPVSRFEPHPDGTTQIQFGLRLAGALPR